MKLAVFAGVLLFGTSVQAQRVNVRWSEESKNDLEYGSFVKGTGNEMIKLCFDNKGGFLSKKTITPILSRYNDRLVEQGVRSFTVNEENMTFDNLLSVGQNLYMFTNRYEKSDKSTGFYATCIDAKTLSPKGTPVNLGMMSALDRSRQSDANYELSKDSSKILMFGLSPYSKKDNEKYYMAVYDKEMNKLWDNTVELPYLDKYVVIFDYVVTNNGDVGVLIKHYDREVKKERVREDGANVPAYKAKLLLYAKGNAKPKEYILGVQDKFVHELQVTADANNNLTMFGLYKNKYDGYVNGYFITTVNAGGTNVELGKMEAFPEEMVSLIKNDRQGSAKEKDPGLSANFSLSDVVNRGDGSTDYLLEFYKVVYVTVAGSSRSMNTTYTDYHYGDIIDVHVSPGKPTGFIRVPKYQQTTNTNLYSSFKALTRNNKLFLFYNDDRDNVDRDLSKSTNYMLRYHKSVLAMAIIDANDSLQRSQVYDSKEMKRTACIRICRRISMDAIGLYAQCTGGLFGSGTSKDVVGMLSLQ